MKSREKKKRKEEEERSTERNGRSRRRRLKVLDASSDVSNPCVSIVWCFCRKRDVHFGLITDNAKGRLI